MARKTSREGLLRTWLVRGGQFALTVAVTWLIVSRVGLDVAALREIDAAAWLPDPALLTAASLLLLASYFVSAALWGLIVHELGGPAIPVTESVRLFMIANLGRYVPGKIWQVAGLAALAKGRGVPATTATGAAILGQGISLVAASAVGMGAFLGGPGPYRRWGLAGAAVVGTVIVLVSIPRVFRALADRWFQLTGTQAHEELGAVHGLRWLGLYLINWVMYALSFWILARSLGLGGALLPVASSFAAAYVLGYAMVFAPAGLGPREGFLILFLTPHLGAGASGLIAVVARLWTTLVEILPAGVFWFRRLATASQARTDGAEGGGA